MAELEPPTTPAPDAATPAPGRGKDDVALELMKFIAVTTGYGRTQTNSAGFSGKPGTRSIDEQTEALLELFDRCRKAVNKEV
jgi:hypothetical protein